VDGSSSLDAPQLVRHDGELTRLQVWADQPLAGRGVAVTGRLALRAVGAAASSLLKKVLSLPQTSYAI
jgi:hypothetical protein